MYAFHMLYVKLNVWKSKTEVFLLTIHKAEKFKLKQHSIKAEVNAQHFCSDLTTIRVSAVWFMALELKI